MRATLVAIGLLCIPLASQSQSILRYNKQQILERCEVEFGKFKEFEHPQNDWKTFPEAQVNNLHMPAGHSRIGYVFAAEGKFFLELLFAGDDASVFARILPKYEFDPTVKHEGWERSENPYFLREFDIDQLLQRLSCVKDIGKVISRERTCIVHSGSMLLCHREYDFAVVTLDRYQKWDPETETVTDRRYFDLDIRFTSRISGTVNKKRIVNSGFGAGKIKIERKQYKVLLDREWIEVSPCEYGSIKVGAHKTLRYGSIISDQYDCKVPFSNS